MTSVTTSPLGQEAEERLVTKVIFQKLRQRQLRLLRHFGGGGEPTPMRAAVTIPARVAIATKVIIEPKVWGVVRPAAAIKNIPASPKTG